uniref:Uncharacterized protein n=1 Tax=Periophthalmus magnuspinnatus TaxID=409849 RepID=A0A3B4AT21_9GOBI
ASGLTVLVYTVIKAQRRTKINIDKVLAGRTGVKFFFPLCGKAVDMKW